MKPHRLFPAFRFTATASLALALTVSAQAANFTWTSTANTTLGGTGTWNTSAPNNWRTTVNVAWPTSGEDNDAIFGTTAGTVTIGAPVTVNDMWFNITGYILSGANTITLNGATPTITVVTGTTTIGNNTATILAGSAGLTKAGAGTLTLNGTTANTFTGGVNLTGGTLALSFVNMATPTNLINSDNALTLGRGTTLSVAGHATAETTQTFNGTSIGIGNSYTSVVKGASANATLALGNLTQSEVGAVISIRASGTAASTSTGNITTVGTGNARSANIGSWALVGDAGSSNARWAYVDASGRVIAATNTATTNMATVTSATTAYNITPAVTNTTYTLGANMTSFGLLVNDKAPVINTSGWTVTTEGIINMNTSLTISGTGNVRAGTGNELVVAGAAGVTISAPIVNGVNGTSHLTYAGSSGLTLMGAHTYTGFTTINAGGISLGNGAVAGTLSPTGNIRNFGTFTINNPAGTITQGTDFSNNISGTGGLTKSGVGTLVLGGSGNTYTGTTTVSAGTLAIGSNTTFGGGLAMSGTGILDLNGFNASFTSTGAGVATANITNSASGTGTATLTTAFSSTYLGLITDGATAKTALVLSNSQSSLSNVNNTFSGGILLTNLSRIGFVNGAVGSGDSITNGPFGRGTITIGANATDGAQIYSTAGGLTLANNIIVNTEVSVGSVPGAFRLHGTTAYNLTGNITANLANIRFTNWGTQGGGNGTINLTGQINGSNGVTLSYANTSAASTFFTVNMANAAETNSYNGTTSLSGGTAVNVVTLRLGANNQLPDGTGKGTLNIGNSAVFDMNGYSDTINGFSGTGTGIIDNVANAGGATSVLTVGANNTTSSFTGVIRNTTGLVAITKNGTGTLTLNGTNSYGGGTTVNAGTLTVGTLGTLAATTGTLAVNNANTGAGTAVVLNLSTVNDTTTGSLSGTIATPSGGTNTATINTGGASRNFTVNQTANATFAGAIAGAGSFTLGSGSNSTLTLTGNNTYSGATAISAGILKANAVNALGGTSGITVSNGATLEVATSNSIRDAATVGLAGGTIVRGAAVTETFGALTLTADSFIDFGATGTGTLNFGTYANGSNTYKLAVTNFLAGNVLTFKTDLSSDIETTSLFTFDNGFTYGWDSGNSTFTITAVPEPSTIIAAILFLGLVCYRERRRIRALFARAKAH